MSLFGMSGLAMLVGTTTPQMAEGAIYTSGVVSIAIKATYTTALDFSYALTTTSYVYGYAAGGTPTTPSIEGTAYEFGISNGGADFYLMGNTIYGAPMYFSGSPADFGYSPFLHKAGELIDSSEAWYAATPFTTTFGAYGADMTFGTAAWSAYEYASFTDYFVGIKFYRAAAFHYGWIRISGDGTGTWTITGWAFESSAATGILTTAAAVPEPGAAGLAALALGALGLSQWRRRREEDVAA